MDCCWAQRLGVSRPDCFCVFFSVSIACFLGVSTRAGENHSETMRCVFIGPEILYVTEAVIWAWRVVLTQLNRLVQPWWLPAVVSPLLRLNQLRFPPSWRAESEVSLRRLTWMRPEESCLLGKLNRFLVLVSVCLVFQCLVLVNSTVGEKNRCRSRTVVPQLIEQSLLADHLRCVKSLQFTLNWLQLKWLFYEIALCFCMKCPLQFVWLDVVVCFSRSPVAVFLPLLSIFQIFVDRRFFFSLGQLNFSTEKGCRGGT